MKWPYKSKFRVYEGNIHFGLSCTQKIGFYTMSVCAKPAVARPNLNQTPTFGQHGCEKLSWKRFNVNLILGKKYSFCKFRLKNG